MTDTTDAAIETAPGRTPKNRAARAVQIAIAAIGASILAVTVAYGAVFWPRTPVDGPAGDVPIGWAPWAANLRSSPADVTFAQMNAAMREKDRDKFLAQATGQAAEQLALWWDNSMAMGWNVAAIAPTDLDLDENGNAEVVLGAQYVFAAHPERGSGDRDAGLQLIQGFTYTVTFEPGSDRGRSFDQYEQTDEPEAATILSVVPTYEPNPWDEGSIHVAMRDHVVLIGMSDEADLVERNADVAEQSAVIALDAIRALGGEPTQDGFVSAITDDPERFSRWQYGQGTPWDMDVAGYARPALRPNLPERFIDPQIATGTDTSGTLVVMGPLSADSRESTFVHEFAHALHNTAAPGSFVAPPAAVMEGFARYVQWESGVADRGYLRQEVKDAVAADGTGAFSDELLRSQDAGIAYDAAGSYYAYAASTGTSVWRLAIDAVIGGGFGVDSDDVVVSEWQAWVAAQG